MSFATSYILAARSNVGSGWIIGLIFVGIWVISAAVNAANKYKEERRRREARERLERAILPPPALPQRAQQQQRRLPPRQQKAQPPKASQPKLVQRKVMVAKQQTFRAAPPPLAAATPAAIETPATAGKQDVSLSEIGSTERHATKLAASAASLRQWLRPQTLRQQFVLTEILQAPIALRGSDEMRWS